MISHKHKCIFVHLPKVAGGSIERLVTGKGWNMVREEGMKVQHEPAISLERYYGEHWNDYFKFSFVRNPWSLVLSNFLWTNRRKRRKERLNISKMTRAEFMDHFKFFILNIEEEIKPSKFIGRGSDAVWDCSQLSFLKDSKGSMGMDFVGKFEALKEDLNVVRKAIGVRRNKGLTHQNKTPKKNMHYSHFYNNEVRDIVMEKYKEDIEYFEYRFEE